MGPPGIDWTKLKDTPAQTFLRETNQSSLPRNSFPRGAAQMGPATSHLRKQDITQRSVTFHSVKHFANDYFTH